MESADIIVVVENIPKFKRLKSGAVSIFVQCGWVIDEYQE